MRCVTDTAIAEPVNSSIGVRWDLTALFATQDDCRAAMRDAIADCRRVRERYGGRVAKLDAGALASALEELASLENRLARVTSYAMLALSVDVTGEAERDLNVEIDRAEVEARNLLRFFELEWVAIDDERAAPLIAAAQVKCNRHYLCSLRRFALHTRTESEEDMLKEREPAATSAWEILFNQVTSTLRVRFEGREATVDELLGLVRDNRRERRLGAYDAVFAALAPHAPVQAHIYDTLVSDRLAMDRVRGYAGFRAVRDLQNELPAASVDAMLDGVERRYSLAHRWFRRKADLLGLERLALADQYAPLGVPRRFTYPEATETVASALGQFSSRLESVARSLFAEKRIDAEPRVGKRGGAFCASVAQDAKPYLLLNFTENLDDVRTLAHELGHGMQSELSGERQTALAFRPPLALAEVPSTFAEMIVFDRLLSNERDSQKRLALLASSIESSFGTIFRQTLMVRYEQAAYTLRSSGKALLPDRLCAMWLDASRPFYGDTVELPDGYRYGWAYIPHFIATRFYTYAYVFAHLVSRVLYARYRADPDGFVGPYLDFLASGHCASPAEQLAPLGIDIARGDWVDEGFGEIERLIELAEREAA